MDQNSKRDRSHSSEEPKENRRSNVSKVPVKASENAHYKVFTLYTESFGEKKCEKRDHDHFADHKAESEARIEDFPEFRLENADEEGSGITEVHQQFAEDLPAFLRKQFEVSRDIAESNDREYRKNFRKNGNQCYDL